MKHHITYSAGVMIMTRNHPNELSIVDAPGARPSAYVGPRVRLPTSYSDRLDRRDDIGEPDRIDVYYGINDYQIAVARLDPGHSPHAAS